MSQLCDNLRYGARIGFEGERTPRFSKHLPTAVAHPSIVTSNFENEISLGRVAGPFDTPQKIFHLSFPKSGTTSSNSSISKEDFSLQYVTIDNAIEGIKSIIEPPSLSPPYDNICRQTLTAMLLTFRNISIPIAASKTQGPLKVLEFMGIILDSVRMEARLPADKIERLRAAFDLFQNKW